MYKIDIPHSTSVQTNSTDQPLQFTINELITLNNPKVFSFSGKYLVLDIGTVIDKESWLSNTLFTTTFAKRWLTSIDEAKSRTFEDNTLYVIGGNPDLMQVIYMNNTFLNQTVEILSCVSLASAIGLIDWNNTLGEIDTNKQDIVSNTQAIVSNTQAIENNKANIDINIDNILEKQTIFFKNQFYFNKSGTELYLDHIIGEQVEEISDTVQEYVYSFQEDSKINGDLLMELQVKGTGNINIDIMINSISIAPQFVGVVDNPEYASFQILFTSLFKNVVLNDTLTIKISIDTGMIIKISDKISASIVQIQGSGGIYSFWDIYGGDSIPPTQNKVYSSEKVAELLATKEDRSYNRTLYFSSDNKISREASSIVSGDVSIPIAPSEFNFDSLPTNISATINSNQVINIIMQLKNTEITTGDPTMLLLEFNVYDSATKTNKLYSKTTSSQFVLTSEYQIYMIDLVILDIITIPIGGIIENVVSCNNTGTFLACKLDNVSFLNFEVNQGSYNPDLNVSRPIGSSYTQVIGKDLDPHIAFPNTTWELIDTRPLKTVIYQDFMPLGGMIKDLNITRYSNGKQEVDFYWIVNVPIGSGENLNVDVTLPIPYGFSQNLYIASINPECDIYDSPSSFSTGLFYNKSNNSFTVNVRNNSSLLRTLNILSIKLDGKWTNTIPTVENPQGVIFENIYTRLA